MLIYFGWPQLLVSMAALLITLILFWRQGKSISYLFFFSIFWFYLMKLVSLVVFPSPVPRYAPYFRPQFNIIPFDFGTCSMLILCIRTIYQNILLTIPFGFGISFIKPLKAKNVLWLAFLVGFVTELVQLVISLAVRSPFRVIDINDVLLNAIGVLIGYGLFRMFGWFYLWATKITRISNRVIFSYIDDVVRQSTAD